MVNRSKIRQHFVNTLPNHSFLFSVTFSSFFDCTLLIFDTQFPSIFIFMSEGQDLSMWILLMYVRSWETLVPRSWALEEDQVQYSTVQYSTIQYSTVQYSTVQYKSMPCPSMQCPVITVEADLNAVMLWLPSVLSVISSIAVSYYIKTISVQ